jgi:NAD(P)-dependent dehydrogenase (short-subunit alcohol dehydrogenase family)
MTVQARHAGSVALVTGAASGIGRATAVQLATEGAHVVACDIKPDVKTAFDEAVLDVPGAAEFVRDRIVSVVADLTQQSDVDRVVAAADAFGRPVNLLANVAGIMDGFLPAHEVDDDTWSSVMSVNVDAVMRLCRAVLPGMLANGGGAIVNIGSIAGARGGAAGVAYTTSKHALVGLTKSIAWTYATQGVRCNLILPGYVRTGINETGDPRSAFGLQRAKPILAQSICKAEPDDVAPLISWLLSGEAHTVNGAAMAADSGWTAG